MARRESKLAGKIPIDMTAMIDVVFQLLTFFMLTLKTVIVEGDFNIRMPLGASNGAAEELTPPITIKMSASPDGHLSDVRIGTKAAAGRDIIDELAAANAAIDAAAGTKNGPQIASARKAKESASKKLVASIQQQIIDAIGNDLSRAEHTELVLDCDPGLQYDNVICAITAASGIVQGDQVVPLIQKIKFSPPKKAK